MNLLALSGFVPEQICDVKRFSGYQGDEKISHYCGYVSDYISQVINDESIDGAVFPKSCDSTRVIGSYLQDCGKFAFQVNVPTRQDEAAVKFMASGLKQYKDSLEQHYGIEIRDIQERTELVNDRNRRLKELYETIEGISYASYLEALHTMLQQPLREQKIPSGIKSSGGEGKKIFLVGSFLANHKIAETVERAGLNIAGDNLTESRRLFSAPEVSLKDDIYENIARSILQNRMSPTQNNFSGILSADMEEIKAKDIRGVLFVTQKYCEPYDYLLSVYKKMLDEKGIPVLKISLADSTDSRVMEAALEAFADIL